MKNKFILGCAFLAFVGGLQGAGLRANESAVEYNSELVANDYDPYYGPSAPEAGTSSGFSYAGLGVGLVAMGAIAAIAVSATQTSGTRAAHQH